MLYKGEEPIRFVLLINAITASLPSALFLLLFLILAFLKVIPDIVRQKIVDVIVKVAINDKPVLSQLASFCGFVAALTSALVSLIGK